MASYLPQVSDTFSGLDLYQPNFALLGQAVATRQNRYDQGLNAVKSVYNSLFNSPLTSTANIAYRQDFFKKLGSDFANASKLDLSQAANVRSAQQLLSPLLNDKDLISDMVKTKQYQTEYAKMEQVKTSSDQKVRAGYSPVMESYMNDGMEALRNAKRGDGSVDSAGVHKFIPFTNVESFLSEKAHAMGYAIEKDHLSGMYKLSSTNGAKTAPLFQTWAKQQMADGSFDQQFAITGQVRYNQFRKAALAQNPNLTGDQLAAKIVQDNHLAAAVDYEDNISDAEKEIANLDNQAHAIGTKYHGKPPKDQLQVLTQMRTRRETMTKQLNDYKQTKPTLDAHLGQMVEGITRDAGATLGDFYKNQAAHEWASSYAQLTEKEKIDDDPVALHIDTQRHLDARQGRDIAFGKWKVGAENAQQKVMAGIKFGYDVKLKEMDQKNDIFKIGYEASFKDGQGGMYAGNMTYTNEPLSLLEASDHRLTELVKKSTDLLHNSNAIIMAGGLRVNANGESVDKQVDFQRIQNLLEKSRLSMTNPYQALNEAERAQMTTYLRRINPQATYKNYASTIKLMQSGLATHGADAQYKPLGHEAVDKFGEGLAAAQEYAKNYNSQQDLLRSKLRNPAFAEKIGSDHGVLFVKPEYAKDPEVANWVTDPATLQHYTAQSRRELYLNTETKNVSPVFWGGLFSQATEAGHVGNNGQFSGMSPDELTNIKTALGSAGSGNMSNIFDTQGARIVQQRVNGKNYLEVTLPVKRTGDKKEESALTPYVDSEIRDKTKRSSAIMFRIPADKAAALAGGDKILNTPFGEMKLPDPMRKAIGELSSDIDLGISPMSDVLNLPPGQTMNLPGSLGVYGMWGTVTAGKDGNKTVRLHMGNDKNAEVVQTNLPEGTPAQQYQALLEFGRNYYNHRSTKAQTKAERVRQQQASRPTDYAPMSSVYPY